MRARPHLCALVLLLAFFAAACGTNSNNATQGEAPIESSEDPSPAETNPEAETPDEETSSEVPAGGVETELRPAIVTDVGGLGDQSFNDSAFAGLSAAAEEYGFEPQVLESAQPTDYETNLIQLAEEGFSPIFAVGFLFTDAVTAVASQFPDTQFGIVDTVVEAPNVASLVFEEQQGSYLAGVVAGLMTQQDTEFTTAGDKTVGFLGGLEGSELIEKFEAGYAAGVASVCPDCEVLVQYAGTTPDAFNDPVRGQEIALSMNDSGADVIYHAAGATGAGLFDAASDQGFFAIGVDSDQAQLVPDAPILTSMLKRVDVAVQTAIDGAEEGSFPSGEVTAYGLQDDGIALADFGRFADVVPEEVTTAVDEARAAIISGEVEVPTVPEG